MKHEEEQTGAVSMRHGAETVAAMLRKAGHTAYFAGGCVRDLCLGRTPKDYDIATSALPEQVQEALPRVTDMHGKNFGVLRALEGGHTYEVATFRNDGAYSDGRRPAEVTFSTPEEDARRRDFTVNGMFLDPATDEVIDFVGGRADLEARTLRAIGDPEKRFREDHLRLYRAVRLAADLGFAIEPATWTAVKEWASLGANLAPERVRDELLRCFTGPDPGRAMDLLDEAALLEPWIPELRLLKGVEQPPQFHPEGDVYVHTRLMVGMLRNADPVLAFSVLLHDIAKPDTYTVDSNGRIRFNGHESLGAQMAEQILRRLRFSNDFIAGVSTCIANHMAFKDTTEMRVSKLKRFLARPTMETEMELHRIDCLACHADLSIHEFLRAKQAEFSSEPIMPEPMVNGHDLIALGAPPGSEIGRLLRILMDVQLEGRFSTREHALVRAKSLVDATLPH